MVDLTQSSNDEKWPPLVRFPVAGEVYLHKNGLAYDVVCLANYEDQEDILVILCGKDGCVWAKRLGVFMGLKNHEARFRLNQSVNPI